LTIVERHGFLLRRRGGVTSSIVRSMTSRQVDGCGLDHICGA
jgi:hypothetical protein